MNQTEETDLVPPIVYQDAVRGALLEDIGRGAT